MDGRGFSAGVVAPLKDFVVLSCGGGTLWTFCLNLQSQNASVTWTIPFEFVNIFPL